jgi:hypothetical protein
MKTQPVSNALSRHRPATPGTLWMMINLGITLLTLAVPATSRAVEKFSASGPSASASFASTDECISTYAYVSAATDVIHQPPGPANTSTTAYLTVVKSDACQYTLLVDGNGSATLGDTDFQVGKRLDTATLKTTINVYDSVSDSYIDVDVDLAWKATGQAGRSTVITHDTSADLIFHQKMTGAGRVAEAAGTVSDGTTNFSPEPTPDGFIQNVSTGNVTIFRKNGGP